MRPKRRLRGERYVEKSSDSVVRLIRDVLPYLEFDEATELYKTWAPDLEQHEVALLGCNDRYFLLTGLLNRKDAIHPWLYDRCREVESRPDGFLDLWARFHFKSTIITFAGSIQEALDNPEIRMGIFSNTKDISSKFLAQIKNELETNKFLQTIYDDVLYSSPKIMAPSWSVDKGLTIRRSGNPKEATFEAHGLDALPTGRHFPLLIFDDVITERNVTNPDQIKKASDAIELADNLGDLHETRKWYIGTRYSFADTYGQLLENEIVKPRIYPATHNGHLDGDPVLLTKERWEDIKKAQRTTVAAQHLQNPLAGSENTFMAEWLEPFWVRPVIMNVYIMADPSLGGSSTSDRTAIAVVGIDSLMNKYLLDGYCHRMSLSERWKAIRDLHKKWTAMPGVQTVKVGYERYGLQSDLEYFAERMRLESRTFDIVEVSWTRNRGQESKAHRVARLEPDFRNGQFFVPSKVWHPNSPLSPKVKQAIEEGHIEAPADTSTAYWSVNKETNQIAYRAAVKQHAQERAAINSGERWRMIDSLRRVDEDGNIYDLTRVFFEEYMFFPFSPRDDLVDAMSRIYDMEPLPAFVHETIEVMSYPDD